MTENHEHKTSLKANLHVCSLKQQTHSTVCNKTVHTPQQNHWVTTELHQYLRANKSMHYILAILYIL